MICRSTGSDAPWKHIPPEDIRPCATRIPACPECGAILGQAATYRLAQELQPSLPTAD